MYRAIATALLVASCSSMSVAMRLLQATGGGSVAATAPPLDASWVRSASNPILIAAVAWEGTWVQEPTVVYESGTWKMWYTGGAGAGSYAIGYATCTGDPTDPANWTKYAGNPVIGQGGSGIAGDAARNFVAHVGSTYYAYYSDASGNLKVTTSSDGIAWAAPATALANNAAAFATGWQNSHVWNEGGTAWHMLVEATGGTAVDRIVAATTSSNGTSWTTPATGAIASLEITGGYTGGPSLVITKGLYHLWFHASNTTAGGGLPTDLYHAASADLATWTVSPATPVLTHAGSGFEVVQAADPSVVVQGATAYLFYTGAVDGSFGPFKIGVATALAVP